MIITTTRNPLSIRLLGNPPVNSGWNRSESVLLQIILRSVLCHVRVNHRQTPLCLQTDYLPAIVSLSAAARISAHDNVRYHVRRPGRLIYAVLANAISVTWSVGFEDLLLPHMDMFSTRHCFHENEDFFFVHTSLISHFHSPDVSHNLYDSLKLFSVVRQDGRPEWTRAHWLSDYKCNLYSPTVPLVRRGV